MTASPNRVLGVAFGALFLLLGIVGLLLGGSGSILGVLGALPALSVIRILVGSALLLAAVSSLRAAATVNSIVGGLLLVLGLVGLFLVGFDVNVLGLYVPDNVVHFGSAAVLLAVGLGADKASPARS